MSGVTVALDLFAGTGWGVVSMPAAARDACASVLAYRPGARTTEPGRVVGAKPAVFCRWVFDLLGAEPQDQFDDLFAGSGGVARAWSVFSGTYSLPAVREVPA